MKNVFPGDDMTIKNFFSSDLKFVDTDALSKLLNGSHEDIIEKVTQAFESVNDLFQNESENSKVKVVGTFSDKVVLVNEDGRFYEVFYTINEDKDNSVDIGVIQEIEVPVRTTYDLGVEAQILSVEAAKAMLRNDKEKLEEYRSEINQLMELGIKITPESLKAAVDELLDHEHDWMVAVTENEEALSRFVGSYSGGLKIESIDSVLPTTKKILMRSFESLQKFVNNILSEVARVKVDKTVVESDRENISEILEQFDMFSLDFTCFVKQALSLIENAQSFDAIPLTRKQIEILSSVHNSMVERLKNIEMAAAFCEQFARSVQ